MDTMQFSVALSSIWKLVRFTNKYIDETAPWALNKQQEKDRLHTVLYHMVEAIRMISVWIQPFMTDAPKAIFSQFGFDETETTWESTKIFGSGKPLHQVSQQQPLFPRLDVEKELAALSELTGTKRHVEQVSEPILHSHFEEVTNEPNWIGIDTFSQVELRVGQILSAEKIEGADKLLKLQIDVGQDVRQIVSGIAKYYHSEELVGQKVVVVANLKPVKLRGVESNGMILAASKGDQLKLVTVPISMENGAVVK